MQFGIPADTHLILFQGAVASLVFASQLERRLRSRLEGVALLSMSKIKPFWDVVDLLRLAAWPAMIVLAFLQLRFVTALIYLIPIAFVAALAVGFYIAWAIRREMSQMLLAFRATSAIAVIIAIYLWAQAISA